MIYKPFLPFALAALLSAAPVQANTTDGLIIGGMAGLTAGFITSAIARHANHRQPHYHHHHHDRVYVEQPTRIVERPVVVEQVIEHRPVVVQERVRTSNVTYQQPMTTHTSHTYHQAPQQQHPQAPQQAHPAPQQAPSLMERELALKEHQVKLDILKEENRKSELRIKEIELELQLKAVTKKS